MKKASVRPGLLMQNEKANDVWNCGGVHSPKLLYCLGGFGFDGSLGRGTHVFRKDHKDNARAVVRGMELLVQSGVCCSSFTARQLIWEKNPDGDKALG